MFILIRLSPRENNHAPSDFFLHPLLAPEHLDDFSLPLGFPVDAQAQLHIQGAEPVIYCKHSRCDVLHNGTPATRTPRRVHTGDAIKILSSDAPTSAYVNYAIQVAYFSFNSDLRQEAALGLQRMKSAAELALQTDTTACFPLSLPLQGDLPCPTPTGTNWTGIRALVEDVRVKSSQPATHHQRPHQLSEPISPPCDVNSDPPLPSRTYAQLIAQASPSPHDPYAALATVDGTLSARGAHASDTRASPRASVSSFGDGDGIELALTRLRAGWITARRTMLETDISFSSSLSTPGSHSSPSFPHTHSIGASLSSSSSPSPFDVSLSSPGIYRPSAVPARAQSAHVALQRIQTALLDLRSYAPSIWQHSQPEKHTFSDSVCSAVVQDRSSSLIASAASAKHRVPPLTVGAATLSSPSTFSSLHPSTGSLLSSLLQFVASTLHLAASPSPPFYVPPFLTTSSVL